ncbi:MAG: ABC transporter permease [Bacteroidales bacterium]|nr:ABC transporter permease [Bacteroidales bacterium]
MFINYIITAWRSLLKNKTVSIINIGGLTIGLASAVLALLFAQHELTYEEMHEKADRICGVYIKGDLDQINWIPNNYGPDGPTLSSMFPEIKNFARLYEYSNAPVRVDENIFYENNVYAVDSNIFSILTFSFLSGSPSNDLNTIVISERVAKRYFGDTIPIGKSMTITLRDQKNDFIITGIFKEFTSNTHLEIDMILPFDVIRRHEWIKPEEYQGTSFKTYVLLNEGIDLNELSQKIELTYKIPSEIENIKAFLMPLKEIHMQGTYENNKGKLIVFLVGGLFVLIITCLNYINLTNILFSTRNKEIGIRKVVGAKQKNIIMQFLTDTVLTTIIAFNLAITIIKLALPWFNALMDTNIQLMSNTNTLVPLAIVFLVSILFSGIYPALRYSFLKPVSLMKPTANVLGGKGRSRFILTTFQFFLAIIFIQIILGMNKHGLYLNSNDYKLYDSENVICISGTPWGDLSKIKEELLKNPIVEFVSWGSSLPEYALSLTTDWKDKDNKTLASIYNFEEDYLNVFKINMLEGRFFSQKFPSDPENSVVINKLAANALDYDNPVGKTVLIGEKRYNIVGVIDSYRTIPPIFDHVPLLIRTGAKNSNYLTIRINPSNREIAHQYITNTLKEFNSDIPIELKYHYDVLFSTTEAKSFISSGKLMSLFFYLTIITSLVGLFGLSLFIAERNSRVISIRKVFGASISNIMLRLSKGIIVQVIIAFILATPVSMMAMTGYLSVFPSSFDLGLFVFLLGGVVAMILVLLTVGWQTWQAANANPANALRFE